MIDISQNTVIRKMKKKKNQKKRKQKQNKKKRAETFSMNPNTGRLYACKTLLFFYSSSKYFHDPLRYVNHMVLSRTTL